MGTIARDGSVALVAFGGNVIHKAGQVGTIKEQELCSSRAGPTVNR